jgi:hypothetical protein
MAQIMKIIKRHYTFWPAIAAQWKSTHLIYQRLRVHVQLIWLAQRMKITKTLHILANDSSTVVKHSPHQTKVEGSSPATAPDTRRENG